NFETSRVSLAIAKLDHLQNALAYQVWREHRSIEILRPYKLHEPLKPTCQGEEKGVVKDEMLLEPEALHHERPGLAVQLEICTCYKPILVENRQGIVAPSPLRQRLIHFPQIFEAKKGQGAAPRAHDVERSQEDCLLTGRCLQGAPLVGDHASVQLYEQGKVFA